MDKDRWISIKDKSHKMPVKSEDFICLYDNGEIRRFYENDLLLACITHWMPLPPLPSPPDKTIDK